MVDVKLNGRLKSNVDYVLFQRSQNKGYKVTGDAIYRRHEFTNFHSSRYNWGMSDGKADDEAQTEEAKSEITTQSKDKKGNSIIKEIH